MEQKVKSTFKRGLGIFLVVFGILGLILPILPGWWVIPIGLELLGWRLIIDRKKPWKEIISLRDKTKDDEDGSVK
ncbi:hypothetical protein KBD75_03820 [Candidatus Woesebacteria bacterium]|nr:hypothetical protein [Candidatus Woesebacteria bacterium]